MYTFLLVVLESCKPKLLALKHDNFLSNLWKYWQFVSSDRLLGGLLTMACFWSWRKYWGEFLISMLSSWNASLHWELIKIILLVNTSKTWPATSIGTISSSLFTSFIQIISPVLLADEQLEKLCLLVRLLFSNTICLIHCMDMKTYSMCLLSSSLIWTEILSQESVALSHM